jgi:hypothetical protein
MLISWLRPHQFIQLDSGESGRFPKARREEKKLK